MMGEIDLGLDNCDEKSEKRMIRMGLKQEVESKGKRNYL